MNYGECVAALTAATAQKKCPKASLINVNTLPRNPMHKSGVGSESAKNHHNLFIQNSQNSQNEKKKIV